MQGLCARNPSRRAAAAAAVALLCLSILFLSACAAPPAMRGGAIPPPASPSRTDVVAMPLEAFPGAVEAGERGGDLATVRHCASRHNALRRHNPVIVTGDAVGYRSADRPGAWCYIRFRDIRRIDVIRAHLGRRNWRGYQVTVGSRDAVIPLFVSAEDKDRLVEALWRAASRNGSALTAEAGATDPI